jgi:hypothetical protein
VNYTPVRARGRGLVNGAAEKLPYPELVSSGVETPFSLLARPLFRAPIRTVFRARRRSSSAVVAVVAQP